MRYGSIDEGQKALLRLHLVIKHLIGNVNNLYDFGDLLIFILDLACFQVDKPELSRFTFIIQLDFKDFVYKVASIFTIFIQYMIQRE